MELRCFWLFLASAILSAALTVIGSVGAYLHCLPVGQLLQRPKPDQQGKDNVKDESESGTH